MVEPYCAGTGPAGRAGVAVTKNEKPTKAQGTARRGRKGKRDGARARRGALAGPKGQSKGSTGEGRPPATIGQSALTRGGARPLWVPEGVDLDFVPEEVRQAIGEVVQPVYERFVLGADDPLEMSLGVTIAHLLWLEVLQQFDLKREYTQITAVLKLSDDRSGVIEQHLRIIYSKVKVGYLLARLRELRHKLREDSEDAASLPEAPLEGGWRTVEGRPEAPGAGGSLTLDPSHPDDPSHQDNPSHPNAPSDRSPGPPNAEKRDLVDQNGAAVDLGEMDARRRT